MVGGLFRGSEVVGEELIKERVQEGGPLGALVDVTCCCWGAIADVLLLLLHCCCCLSSGRPALSPPSGPG